MADFKQNMFRRLRSARQWLKHAEEAYDTDRDIRAELDLMLAQAELQQAKEVHRNRRWWYKYSPVTQGLAVGMAMTIAAIGFGGTYWWMTKQQTSMPALPLAAQQENKAPELTKPEYLKVQLSEPTSDAKPMAAERKADKRDESTVKPMHQQNVQQAEIRAKDDGEARQADREPVLPPEELQKLVRAAGKSLRGQ